MAMDAARVALPEMCAGRRCLACQHIVTQHELRDRLRALGLKRSDLARACGISLGWLYRLGTPERPFPAWLPLLLAAWEDNKRLGGPSLCRSGIETHDGASSRGT